MIHSQCSRAETCSKRKRTVANSLLDGRIDVAGDIHDTVRLPQKAITGRPISGLVELAVD